MNTMCRVATLAAIMVVSTTRVLAVDEHFIDDSVVVGGYDVVAYHTMGKPAMGNPEYSASYQGGTWQFSSKEHMDLFVSDPAKYAPAYGGWCAAGASKGKKVPTKPDLWAIVDGQLYLNSSPKAHDKLFLAKTDEVIRKGEANWKSIFATPRDEL